MPPWSWTLRCMVLKEVVASWCPSNCVTEIIKCIYYSNVCFLSSSSINIQNYLFKNMWLISTKCRQNFEPGFIQFWHVCSESYDSICINTAKMINKKEVRWTQMASIESRGLMMNMLWYLLSTLILTLNTKLNWKKRVALSLNSVLVFSWTPL